MSFNYKVFSFYYDFEFLIFIFYFSDFQRVVIGPYCFVCCMLSILFADMRM